MEMTNLYPNYEFPVSDYINAVRRLSENGLSSYFEKWGELLCLAQDMIFSEEIKAYSMFSKYENQGKRYEFFDFHYCLFNTYPVSINIDVEKIKPDAEQQKYYKLSKQDFKSNVEYKIISNVDKIYTNKPVVLLKNPLMEYKPYILVDGNHRVNYWMPLFGKSIKCVGIRIPSREYFFFTFDWLMYMFLTDYYDNIWGQDAIDESKLLLNESSFVERLKILNLL